MEKDLDKSLLGVKICFFAWLIPTVALVCIGEFSDVITGLLAGNDSVEFVLEAVMELWTIAIVVLSLRAFKFKSFAYRALRTVPAWKYVIAVMSVRVIAIELTLFCNMLFYYLFMQSVFLYLSLILLIACVFVYPSRGNAMTETEKLEKK